MADIHSIDAVLEKVALDRKFSLSQIALDAINLRQRCRA